MIGAHKLAFQTCLMHPTLRPPPPKKKNDYEYFMYLEHDIKFTEKNGVGYDENGDVCINIMQPIYRDLVVKSCVYIAGKPLKLKYQDAFCKIKV